MTRNNPRLHDLLAILVATAALELGATQVHAMGYGFGIMGGFNYVPSPGDFLNQHSLLNAGRARGPVSNNVYANNPNAFIHRIRDNGFVPHAGIVDRRSPGYQASRWRPQNLSQTSNNQPQPAASSATATAPAGGPDRQLFRRVADAGLAERCTRRGRPDHEARYIGSSMPGRLGSGRQAQVSPDHDRDVCTSKTARVRSARAAVHAKPYDAADRRELPPVHAIALRLTCGRSQSNRACLGHESHALIRAPARDLLTGPVAGRRPVRGFCATGRSEPPTRRGRSGQRSAGSGVLPVRL